MLINTLPKAIQEARAAAEAAEEYKSETYLAVLLTELLRAEAPPARGVQTNLAHRAALHVTQKPFSAPEFFAARTLKSELDKVVAAGYFLEHYSDADRFNVNDVRSCLVSGKIPLPKNIPLALLKTVQRGWIMEVPEGKDDIKAYVLTQSGELYVNSLEKDNK